MIHFQRNWLPKTSECTTNEDCHSHTTSERTVHSSASTQHTHSILHQLFAHITPHKAQKNS